MTTRERIGIALERTHKSQRDLAKFMGLSSPTVSAMLSKEEIDSIKYLRAVETLTGFRFEWLRTGDGAEKKQAAVASHAEEPTVAYWRDKLQTKDELIEELKGRINDMKKYQELLEKQTNDPGSGSLHFSGQLKVHGIDPDQYIAVQNEFIKHCRQNLETSSKTISYRNYLERDQLLTIIEKFVNLLEKEKFMRLEESKNLKFK